MTLALPEINCTTAPWQVDAMAFHARAEYAAGSAQLPHPLHLEPACDLVQINAPRSNDTSVSAPSLPIYAAVRIYNGPKGGIGTEGGMRATSDGHTTVLAVDDDPLVLSLLESALKAAGYHVIPADSGWSAIQAYEKAAPI